MLGIKASSDLDVPKDALSSDKVKAAIQNLRFIQAARCDFVSRAVNVTTITLHKLFHEARNLAKCQLSEKAYYYITGQR